MMYEEFYIADIETDAQIPVDNGNGIPYWGGMDFKTAAKVLRQMDRPIWIETGKHVYKLAKRVHRDHVFTK